MDTRYDSIAQAIDRLCAGDAPSLDALAAQAGYSTAHFQKLFTEMVGISPKQFARYLQYRHARDWLLKGYPTLDAAYAAGLSGQGRLHDSFITFEAATPGEVRARGQGMTIYYHDFLTAYGQTLIGCTDKGLCWLGLSVDNNLDKAMDNMKNIWQNAEFLHTTNKTSEVVETLNKWAAKNQSLQNLKLHLFGTNFQLQVWQALLKIPEGSSASYRQIADAVGKPKAVRAVGSAIGANPVSILIPCHRVIQSSGIVENYAWGSTRKKALLTLETTRIG